MGTTETVNGNGPKKFVGKLNGQDFSGQTLIRADFRGCSLIGCNFSRCDLSDANMAGANCFGANFKDAKLHRTNFKDAILAQAIMEDADMFGITITLSCDTFDRVKIGRFWWAWLFFGTMMAGPDQESSDRLIALMGPERYLKYRSHFNNRVL